MARSGLTAEKGSGRGVPETYPGAAVTPPVQAGMAPSALPARSAPTGVRRDFNSAASWLDTEAGAAVPARVATIRTQTCNVPLGRIARAVLKPLLRGDRPVLYLKTPRPTRQKARHGPPFRP